MALVYFSRDANSGNTANYAEGYFKFNIYIKINICIGRYAYIKLYIHHIQYTYIFCIYIFIYTV